MITDVNILLDHITGRKLPLPTYGRQSIDLSRVVTVAEDLGATCAYFPVIEVLAHNNLAQAVAETYPQKPNYELRRFTEIKRDDLHAFLDTLSERDPEIPPNDFQALREQFEAKPVNMKECIGRDKEPIPDGEDLEIMLKAEQLTEGTAFVLSRDGHFTCYEDELSDWLGIQVIGPEEIHSLDLEWRE